MHPRDRDTDMAAAEGIALGVVLGVVMSVAIVAAVAAWGGPAVRYAVWVALVIREIAG